MTIEIQKQGVFYFVKFTTCSACFVPFAANAFSNAAAPSLNQLSLIFAYRAIIVLVVLQCSIYSASFHPVPTFSLKNDVSV
jgi:hypothetical protein